jgi:hypothetical protein
MFLLLSVCSLSAQEKGVDRQNDRIRDSGTDRAPGVNGVKQNTGTGRGIDFGKGRTPAPPPIANPYRFTIRRDIVLRAVEELMAERKLILDTAVSKTDGGATPTSSKFNRSTVLRRASPSTRGSRVAATGLQERNGSTCAVQVRPSRSSSPRWSKN